MASKQTKTKRPKAGKASGKAAAGTSKARQAAAAPAGRGGSKTGSRKVSRSTHSRRRTLASVIRHSPNGRGWRSFFFRFVIAFVALLLLAPAMLLGLYKIEAVHPVSTLMVREALIGEGARRQWVEFEEIAPVLYQSVMMSEDGRFCSHSGVDWTALNAVIDDALEGEKPRGASTITMQTVKNLFLWPERSFIRKGLEVPYALLTELILDKKRIMEIYLNIVELDRGVFGVEAASQHYFGRSASAVGPRYSSLLAVSLPNPDARNPAKPSSRLRRMARTIEKRARASGAYIGCLKQ